MADDNVSDSRQRAEEIFAEARKAHSKGRLAWAVEHAREALRADGSYQEVRHWLAERYVEAGATTYASRQYQFILRADPNDQKAWTALEEIDPPGAAKARRLHEIPPDPFVSERRAQGGGDDFDSIDAATTEQQPEEGAPAPFLHVGERSNEFESLDEVTATQGMGEAESVPWVGDAESSEQFEALDAPADEEVSAAAPSDLWEFEQDREYWRQWLDTEATPGVVGEIERLWSWPDAVDQVLDQCVHLRASSHPEAVAATQTAAQRLGTDPPELFLMPEPDIQPLVFRGEPAAMGLTTAMLRTFSEAELTFIMGRCLGPILSGYLAALQAVDLLLARPLPITSELASMLRDLFARDAGSHTARLTAEALSRMKALGHAWQQRVELSADRAGLLACRDIETACSAIARSTAKSARAAAEVTLEKFMAGYEGQDVQKLAAVPTEDNPSTSADYGAYRIKMLKWWAGTDEYQAACRQLDSE